MWFEGFKLRDWWSLYRLLGDHTPGRCHVTVKKLDIVNSFAHAAENYRLELVDFFLPTNWSKVFIIYFTFTCVSPIFYNQICDLSRISMFPLCHRGIFAEACECIDLMLQFQFPSYSCEVAWWCMWMFAGISPGTPKLLLYKKIQNIVIMSLT